MGRRTTGNKVIISKLSTWSEMLAFHFNLYSSALKLSSISIIFPNPNFPTF